MPPESHRESRSARVTHTAYRGTCSPRKNSDLPEGDQAAEPTGSRPVPSADRSRHLCGSQVDDDQVGRRVLVVSAPTNTARVVPSGETAPPPSNPLVPVGLAIRVSKLGAGVVEVAVAPVLAVAAPKRDNRSGSLQVRLGVRLGTPVAPSPRLPPRRPSYRSQLRPRDLRPPAGVSDLWAAPGLFDVLRPKVAEIDVGTESSCPRGASFATRRWRRSPRLRFPNQRPRQTTPWRRPSNRTDDPCRGRRTRVDRTQ